jgi:hypothetical protein
MANQSYRNRLDNTVGTNSGTKKVVHPAAPELQPKPGAENKTPSPTRTYDPTAKDHTYGRANGNPGTNAYAGAVSIMPGQKAMPAAVNPGAPVDAVLEGLQHGGVRGLDSQDDWQTRSLTDPHDNPKGRVPTNPGAQGARAGGTVPAKCGQNRD